MVADPLRLALLSRFRVASLEPVLRWAAVLGVFLAILAAGAPAGVEPAAWRIFAVFAATIAGLIAQPAAGGFVVLLGVLALALLGTMPIKSALLGYADPMVWLVLAAFMMSRGMIKTGLGRRIAFVFIRALGRSSLGLGYALVSTDFVLASFIPSVGARNGGIVFPIARSLVQAYGSEPGETARRLGAFMMVLRLPVRGRALHDLPHRPGQQSPDRQVRADRGRRGPRLHALARWAPSCPRLLSLAIIPLHALPRSSRPR